MSADLWKLQGDILGSQLTEKDLHEMTNNGATSNPGTVQIHIDRALAKAAAEKVEINRKENCKACNFVAELKPLMQFTVNGGWSLL